MSACVLVIALLLAVSKMMSKDDPFYLQQAGNGQLKMARKFTRARPGTGKITNWGSHHPNPNFPSQLCKAHSPILMGLSSPRNLHRCTRILKLSEKTPLSLIRFHFHLTLEVPFGSNVDEHSQDASIGGHKQYEQWLALVVTLHVSLIQIQLCKH